MPLLGVARLGSHDPMLAGYGPLVPFLYCHRLRLLVVVVGGGAGLRRDRVVVGRERERDGGDRVEKERTVVHGEKECVRERLWDLPQPPRVRWCGGMRGRSRATCWWWLLG